MNANVAACFAALAGLATVATAYFTARRSGLADNNRALDADLRIERTYATDLARWAHEVSLLAVAAGIKLPELPKRKKPEEV